MKHIGQYRSYLLYGVEEQDERDINTSSGSRYIRNSILVFVPNEQDPKIGDEWRCCKSVDEATYLIDKEVQRTPIREQMKEASERSRAQEAAVQQLRESEMEAERRRREQHIEEYIVE